VDLSGNEEEDHCIGRDDHQSWEEKGEEDWPSREHVTISTTIGVTLKASHKAHNQQRNEP